MHIKKKNLLLAAPLPDEVTTTGITTCVILQFLQEIFFPNATLKAIFSPTKIKSASFSLSRGCVNYYTTAGTN